MRQQLLANRLEQAGAHGADVVRVLHVLALENTGYQDSLVRAEHRAVSGSVDEVWAKPLRTPDRFRQVDPVVFLDSALTSDEYVDRYSSAAAIDAWGPVLLGDITTQEVDAVVNEVLTARAASNRWTASAN